MSGTDRMMASKVLRALQDRGLLRRTPDVEDARVLRLDLADDGRALVRKAVRIAVDTDEQIFGQHGDLLREHLQTIGAVRVPNAAGRPLP
ncbi:MarR family transcriptional regulator [Nocardia sp. NPDC051990]|uniref:MarR family transcriptional regulator n=1 Tax=Nocardia sp. NPDC051990 TaxID=3155285 RepID=UPI00342121C9